MLADFTSKYCLLSIQLTSACIHTHQHVNFGCFVCACCLFPIFCLTLYDPGGAFNTFPLYNFFLYCYFLLFVDL